ncbi:MAG: hemagglutinin repeat-containing protein, partial [Burkholderiales bacterium]|nr:hemagglutinin repeat-containing protein [Burkholderiales bacterium]
TAKEAGINNQGGNIATKGQLSLETVSGIKRKAGQLDTSNGIELNNTSGKITGIAGVTINTGALTNVQGQITSGSDLSIDSGSNQFNSAQGSLLSLGDIKLTAGTIALGEGQARAGKGLSATAQKITATKSTWVAAGGDLILDAKNGELTADQSEIATSAALTMKGSASNIKAANITAIGSATLETAALQADQVKINAGGNLGITSNASINAQDAKFITNAGITLQAQELKAAGGSFSAVKDIKLTTAGDTNLSQSATGTHASLISEANLQIKAQGITLDQAKVSAKRVNLDAGTAKLSAKQGDILATDTSGTDVLTINGDGLDNNLGTITSNGDLRIVANKGAGSGKLTSVDGHINALGNIDITAGDIDNTRGEVTTKKNIAITSKDLINETGTVNASEQLTITANKLNNKTGTLVGITQATITSTQLDNTSKALIASNGSVKLTATGIDNSAEGRIASVMGDLKVTTTDVGTINNRNGIFEANTTLDINSTGTIDNTKGKLRAIGAVVIDAKGSITNKDAGLIQSGSTLTITSQDKINNESSSIQAAGDLKLSAQQAFENKSGKLIGDAKVGVTAKSIDNAAGDINAASILTVDTKILGGAIDNHNGKIQAGTSLTLTANGVNNSQQGKIGGKSDVILDSGNGLFDNRNGSVESLNGALTVSAAEIDNSQSQSTVRAATDLTVTSLGTINNQAAWISAGQRLKIMATGKVDNSLQGKITSGTELQINTNAKLDNNHGTLTSGTSNTIVATEVDNTEGTISAKAALSLDAGNAKLTNLNGHVLAGTALKVSASGINNRGGEINANGDLDLTSTNGGTTGVVAELDNNAGHIKSVTGKLTINSGDFKNQGEVAAAGDLKINAKGDFDNSKSTISNKNNLDVSVTGTVNNAEGKLIGLKDLKLSGTDINNSKGTLASDAKVTISATTFTNSEANVSAGGDFTLHTVGAINNEKGTIKSAANLDIVASDKASTFNNNYGTLSAVGTLNVNAGKLDSQYGHMIGEQSLTVDTNGKALDMTKGDLKTKGDITLTVGSAILSNSESVAGNNFTLISTSSGAGDLGVVGTGATIDAKGNINLLGGDGTGNGSDMGFAGGTLKAGKAFVLKGKTITLNNSKLAANEDMNILGASVDATGSEIKTQGTINLEARDRLDYQSAQVMAGKDLKIEANNLGNIGAANFKVGRDLVLDSKQKMVFGAGDFNYQVGGDITVKANGLETTGINAKANKLVFDAGTGEMKNTGSNFTAIDTLSLSGTGIHNKDTHVIANKAVSIDARIGSFENGGGSVASAEAALSIKAASFDNASGKATALTTLDIKLGKATGAALKNNGGTIVSDGTLTIESASLDNTGGVLVSNDANTTIDTGELTNTGGTITSGQTLQVDAKTLTNTTGKLLAAGVVNVNANFIENAGGKIEADGSVTVDSASGVNNSGGVIQSLGANVTVNARAGDVINSTGGVIFGRSESSVTASAVVNNNRGRIASGTEVLAVVSNIGNVSVIGNTILNGNNGVISGSRNVGISAQEINNEGGVISGLNYVTLDGNGAGVKNSGGVIEAGAAGIRVQIGDNGSLTNNDSGTARGIVSTGDISIIGGDFEQNNGYVGSSKNLSITNNSIVNTNSQLLGIGGVTIASSNAVNNQAGSIRTSGDLVMHAGELNNTGGTIFANNNLAIATNVLNNSSTLTSDFTKGILATGSAVVYGTTINNAGGAIASLGNLLVNARTSVSNVGGKLTGDNLTVQTPDFKNKNGSVDAKTQLNAYAPQFSADGVLASLGGIYIELNGDYTNTGTVASATSLDIKLIGGKYTNKGTVSAQTDLGLTATALDNQGSMTAGRDLKLNVDNVTNNGTLNAVNNTTITGTIDNFAKIYGGNIGMTGTVNNHEGAVIGSRGALNMSGSLVNRPNAEVLSLGNMSLNSVVNAGGRISAGGNLSMGSLSNLNCVSGAGGNGAGASNCAAYGLQGGITLQSNTEYTYPNDVTINFVYDPKTYKLNELIYHAIGAGYYTIAATGVRPYDNWTVTTIVKRQTDSMVVSGVSHSGVVEASGSINVSGGGQNVDSQIVAGGNISMGNASQVGDGVQKTTGDTTNISTKATQNLAESVNSYFWHEHFGSREKLYETNTTAYRLASSDIDAVLFKKNNVVTVSNTTQNAEPTAATPANIASKVGGVASNRDSNNGNNQGEGPQTRDGKNIDKTKQGPLDGVDKADAVVVNSDAKANKVDAQTAGGTGDIVVTDSLTKNGGTIDKLGRDGIGQGNTVSGNNNSSKHGEDSKDALLTFQPNTKAKDTLDATKLAGVDGTGTVSTNVNQAKQSNGGTGANIGSQNNSAATNAVNGTSLGNITNAAAVNADANQATQSNGGTGANVNNQNSSDIANAVNGKQLSPIASTATVNASANQAAQSNGGTGASVNTQNNSVSANAVKSTSLSTVTKASTVSTTQQTALSTTNSSTQLGQSAAPDVKFGSQVNNALPGSVIAGGVRAQQQAAINTVTNQFSTYAKARPVTATEAKYNGGSSGAVLQAVPTTQVKTPTGNSTDITLTSTTAWVAPASKLFDLQAKEGSSYVVETDPLFINKDHYLSSDYALKQLTINPERTLKRYGDGFAEQRAIADQLFTMTGRANLAGYAANSAGQQQAYKDLMDAGVAFAKAYQLSAGIALTDQQMALLTTNIIWLQEETVTLPDGSTTKALVPQVYLRRPQGGDLATGGALIAGNNVVIRNKDGDINNSGTILAGYANASAGTSQGVVALDAKNINNQGTVAANILVGNATQDINNLGGKLVGLSTGTDAKVNDSVIDLTAGRDITLASTTASARNKDSSITNINRVATIAAGNIRIDAANNLTSIAAQLNAAKDLTLVAGNNVEIQSLAETRTLDVATGGNVKGRTGYIKEASTTNIVSNLTAGNNLTITAKNDASITGSTINATNNASIQAANVTIQAVKNSALVDVQSVGKKDYARAMTSTESFTGGTVNAGNNLLVIATGSSTNKLDAKGNPFAQGIEAGTGNISLIGATLNGGTAGTAATAAHGSTVLVANNDINISNLNTNNSSITDSYSKSSTLLKSKTTSASSSSTSSQVNGSTVTGNSIAMQSGNDIKIQGSDVVAIDALRINAAHNLTITSAVQTDSSTQSSQTSTSGLTAGYKSGVASIGVGKTSNNAQASSSSQTQVSSSVGSLNGSATLTAGNTLQVIASDLAAKDNLSLIAKNVDLLAAQNTSQASQSSQSKSSGVSVNVTLNPVAAFKDAYSASTNNNQSQTTVGKSLSQAEGTANGVLALLPGLKVGNKQANTAQNDNSSTAKVSTLTAGKDLTIIATDGSITSQGTQLTAEGNALLLAKNNILLDVAHTTQGQDQSTKASGWGIDTNTMMGAGAFNNKGTGKGSTDTITGTQLSVGGTTTLATQTGDITLTATNIASQGDLTINAAKNLTVQSGQDTTNNANSSNNKAIGQVVVSDTERFAGYNKQTNTSNNSQVTQVASNLASLGGNVNLTAKGSYTQTASNVLAKNDINIEATDLNLLEATSAGHKSQESSDLKIGAFARVSSPLIDLINNVDAARKSDGRLKTMQGMAAGANAYQAASAISSMAGGAGSGTLIKGEVGIGFASASNSNNANTNTAIGSTIKADGNVKLTSTVGDITAKGANISAGTSAAASTATATSADTGVSVASMSNTASTETKLGTITLNSAKDILLTASQSTNQSAGQNNSAGAEIGVGYSIGAQTGVYAYAAANVGSGHNNANGTSNNNTHLNADAININSQGNTTLKGATANANSISTDIGGKLTIESLQDTSKQDSTQTNVGGRVQVSFGTAWDASGNASQSKGSGSSQAVVEQSGLFAKDGGYHIKADTVDLKGGAIVSTNSSTNAKGSDLTTNAITFQDIQNKMDYKATSVSMAGGISGGSGAGDTDKNGQAKPADQQQLFGDKKSGNVTPGLPSQTKGSEQSTTYATLTEGNITIGGKSTTAKELGINTDATKANTQINTAPDIKAVLKDQQAMSAAAGTVIATSKQVASDIAANAAKTQADAQKIINDPKSTKEQIAEAEKVVAEAKQTQKDWSQGGKYNQALSVGTALAVDGIAGQGGAATANAIGAVMAKQIGDWAKEKDWAEGSKEKVILHGLSGLIQAKIGGTDLLSGMTASAGKEAVTPLMESYLVSQGIVHDSPEFDKMMKLGASLFGAATSAVIGGGALNINAGTSIAAISETDNRQLHKKELRLAELLAKKSNGQFTEKQIADALRASGNSALGEDITKGMVVPLNKDTPASAIYDSVGMKVTTDGSGHSYLVQTVNSNVDPTLAKFIHDNTGGDKSPYSWGLDGVGNNTPPTTYIEVSKGGAQRYGQFYANGQVFTLPLADCPAASCQMFSPIARFGVSEKDQAEIAAWEAASNKQVVKDLGKGGLVVLTAVTLPATATGIIVGGAIVGGGSSVIDQSVDTGTVNPVTVVEEAAKGAVVSGVTLGVVKGGSSAVKVVGSKIDSAFGVNGAKVVDDLAVQANKVNEQLVKETQLVGDQPYVAPTNTANGFQTHGINTEQVPQPIRDQLSKDLRAGGVANPQEALEQIIESGKTVPIPVQANADTKLYKLVSPEGRYTTPSSSTVYWVDQEQLNLIRANPERTNEILGLPAGSQAKTFNVFEIQPQPNTTPTVYQSQVATTTEANGATSVGNATQTIVPNRSQWTTPKPTGEVIKTEGQVPSGSMPGGDAVGVTGELTGTRTVINSADDTATIRSLTRENESATNLANNGYKVQQNPPTLPNGKNPDYLINGQIFDNYAPSTSNVRNAADVISRKVAGGQAENIVVNLADSSITTKALREQLMNFPIPGLKQVIIIDKSGVPTVIKFQGE